MANPLKFPPPSGPSEPYDLRAMCDRYNFQAPWTKYTRWYYVEPATSEKPAWIKVLDGIEADEVWTVLEGRRIEYVKWDKEKLGKLERRCRWLIARGMLEPLRGRAA